MTNMSSNAAAPPGGDPGPSSSSARTETGPHSHHDASHPANSPSFHLFPLLPAEIRNMIWVAAYRSNAQMHFLCLGKPQNCQLLSTLWPRHYNKYDMSQRDQMEGVWGYYANNQFSSQWSLPGCRKYYTFFRRANHGLSRVCPESRAVVQKYRQDWVRRDTVRPKGKTLPPIDSCRDIFTFRIPKWPHEASLITTRPTVAPTRIAIEVLEGQVPNFGFTSPNPASWSKSNNPALAAALDWGRDAKEEEATGVRATVRPSRDTLAIDLKNLRTIYILSYGIQPRHQSFSVGGRAQISPRHYVEMVHGMESFFYILDTGDEATQAAWMIPGYVAAVQAEMQRRVQGSEVWKVDVKVMAAIHKRTARGNRARILDAPEPAEEMAAMGCYH